MSQWEDVERAFNRLDSAFNGLIAVLRDGTRLGHRDLVCLRSLPLWVGENYSPRMDHLRAMQDEGLVTVQNGLWARTELGDEVLRRRMGHDA